MSRLCSIIFRPRKKASQLYSASFCDPPPGFLGLPTSFIDLSADSSDNPTGFTETAAQTHVATNRADELLSTETEAAESIDPDTPLDMAHPSVTIPLSTLVNLVDSKKELEHQLMELQRKLKDKYMTPESNKNLKRKHTPELQQDCKSVVSRLGPTLTWLDTWTNLYGRNCSARLSSCQAQRCTKRLASVVGTTIGDCDEENSAQRNNHGDPGSPVKEKMSVAFVLNTVKGEGGGLSDNAIIVQDV
ncbi:hypothetical protein K461DRAFT_141757 [Myriangium duriaei CBS 260.36]|uniref:Uncharacterized protein n=1 Tax=Myriangium duriaei CBS 260.36 TaxID=1168546 RepID=A0A9P4J2I4_9PEZI|nr:hypothetical protein K461DRAFT_141757 [Myriangium duriaei CBS 260.36]